MNPKSKYFFVSILLISVFFLPNIQSQNVLSPRELLEIKSCGNVQLSPNGTQILYSISTPRTPNESQGPANITWWKMTLKDGNTTPLFQEGIKGSSPQWSPDGKTIGFLYAEEDQIKQVWALPDDDGEMTALTRSEADVSYFRWNPGGDGLAFLARTPETAKENELGDRGYGFIFFEENLKNTNLYITELDADLEHLGTRQLTEGVNVWDFEFSRQGTQIAAGISPKNLVDHSYMFKRIYLIDLQSGDIRKISENEGKLGNYAFNPDGSQLAYTAALNINDHAVSQVFIISLDEGGPVNLTPENFMGHISWVGWKDDKDLLYYSGEGVYPKLNLVPAKGGKRKIILNAKESGIIFNTPKYTTDFNHFVFTGSTPDDPENIFHWDGKGDLNRLTDINPQLKDKILGKQELIRYAARDGQEIEGLLMYPVGYEEGNKYPLIVYVHGGPESHHSNNWLSRYSTPGQVMAGKGYLVLYLNYRASTGYGVDFAMEGFMNPAGKEFDDIADGIEYIIREKGADAERVGLAGGSYGGFASGWFATYYTKYVKAVCMFVGISDLVSKRGTTDIPYEDMYVHTGKQLEEQWQLNLERSPIYWAHQSKTATLIYGGAADTRVHPSQSLEMYRRMKMNNHPAVRLVQYPGEGHGNRKQTGRIDVLYRQIDWLDWYVRDLKPLDGPMPPLDISDKYGLDWDN
ncbi:prolyl oligopeptidase family serine peptidase [Bacteroidota bacterium]